MLGNSQPVDEGKSVKSRSDGHMGGGAPIRENGPQTWVATRLDARFRVGP
jgi:hypothetical protein